MRPSCADAPRAAACVLALCQFGLLPADLAADNDSAAVKAVFREAAVRAPPPSRRPLRLLPFAFSRSLHARPILFRLLPSRGMCDASRKASACVSALTLSRP